MDTVDRLRARLDEAFAPERLEILDESARHAGHAGAASGGGHYVVRMTSAAFAGLPRLERHRKVHEALADILAGEIHALSLCLGAPGEPLA